jgi:hypothetical protein
MLELRPNCEWCNVDLPPDAANARICSYECTYCETCVQDVLRNVCPTCGGGFVPRPIRPKGAHRKGKTLGLGHQPASPKRVHSQWTLEDVRRLSDALADVEPADR